MKTVKDACQLQPNALSIKLSDQIERLDALIASEGEGKAFFQKTFITQGMQDLISEGLARLAGTSENLLEGNFPDRGLLSANIAAFNGRNNPDHFFWGEIANQLGKADQFADFWTSGPKAPDEKDWLKLFTGDQPVLILLDEMPPYFHYLDTQKVGNGTVADNGSTAWKDWKR